MKTSGVMMQYPEVEKFLVAKIKQQSTFGTECI